MEFSSVENHMLSYAVLTVRLGIFGFKWFWIQELKLSFKNLGFPASSFEPETPLNPRVIKINQ